MLHYETIKNSIIIGHSVVILCSYDIKSKLMDFTHFKRMSHVTAARFTLSIRARITHKKRKNIKKEKLIFVPPCESLDFFTILWGR